MTTSKAPSSKGSASMSATCQVMPAQPLAAARSRMRVTTVGEASVDTMLVSLDARYMSARAAARVLSARAQAQGATCEARAMPSDIAELPQPTTRMRSCGLHSRSTSAWKCS